MNSFIPWKILHLELSEGIPALTAENNTQGFYLIFWWHGIPLGDRVIPITQLPMSTSELTNLITQTITSAVGDQLIPVGFQTALSEHPRHQPPDIPPDLASLLELKQPLAKLEQHLSNLGEESKTVSVIICTRDRPEQLEKCLQSLQTLSPQPAEIIVVDNAPSTEATQQIVSQIPGIRYILEPRPGLSFARNTGITHSTGQIIAFTDDDVIVHPNWITRIQQSFQNPKVMAVTGLVLPGELESESQFTFESGQTNFSWGYRKRIFDQHFFQSVQHLGVPVWRIGAGANMAFRREIFQLIGNFDQRLGAGASGCSEDSEFWYRVLAEGWYCRYEPTAVVFHYHRKDLASFKSQMYQYMRGHVTALLIQFARYKHWGNLTLLFILLPVYYLKVFLSSIIKGYKFRNKLLWTEILGCLAGIKFYLENRISSNN